MAYTRHFYSSCRIDATGATTDRVFWLYRAPEAVDNLVVKIVSDTDITQDDTDYLTLELNSATGLDGTLTPMMTAVTTKTTGGIALLDGEPWTPTLTTDALAAGSCLVLESAHTNAGQALVGALVSISGDYVQS